MLLSTTCKNLSENNGNRLNMYFLLLYDKFNFTLPMKILLRTFILFAAVCSAAYPLFSQAPIANPDTTGVCADGVITINVLDNDIDPSGTGLELDEIIIEPEYGDITFSSDGNITYTPSGAFTGTDVLIYEAKNGLELSDISTLSIFIQDVSGCVWPGDANDNGIANNTDLLFVALFYGNVGPTRYNPAADWDGSYCDEWEDDDDIVIPLNPKFADCNGDGLVDALDSIPILENYGEEHFKTTEISGGDTTPPLLFAFFSDSIEAGSEVTIPIILGSIDYPATNVLGIAFTVEYNADLIVPGSMKATFNTGWLTDSIENIISINRNDTLGFLDVSVARTNHVTASGYGHIGTLGFVMEDNIAGKTSDLISSVFTICPSQPSLINDIGEIRGADNINIQCDSVVVYQVFNAIDNSALKNIAVFPNPADAQLHVQLNDIYDSMEIIDMYGKTIVIRNNVSGNIDLDTRNILPGAYVLKLKRKDNLLMERIIIQHN